MHAPRLRFHLTGRGCAVLVAAVLLPVIALSLDGSLRHLAALLPALLFAYAFFSLLAVACTLQSRASLSETRVLRGEPVTLKAFVSYRSVLPAGDLTVLLLLPGSTFQQTVPARAFREMPFEQQVLAAHVGAFPVGIGQITVRDLFGLFTLTRAGMETQLLLSLPRPFDIEKPTFTAGEEGRSVLSRTTEDYTSPEDTRAYIPGDAMKRIHWKLSSRRRELLVRRFELPAPPDTLILPDCSLPLGGEDQPEGVLRLRDAICETAVAAASLQMGDQSPVRVPVHGGQATEFASDNKASILLLQEMLACQPFDARDDFALQLNVELRRMRRTGAVIIITTRLDARIVEAVSAIRRMGPAVRLYLCTFTPEDPSFAGAVARLQHHLVEVCYVTPV